jgi:predicted transcriptional regulator
VQYWVIGPTSDFDVCLGRGERNAVVSQPLFFCPHAAGVAADHNIGVATILKRVAAAQNAGIVNKADAVGRLVIDNVINCRPTSFNRVVNTLNVMNFILVEDRRSQPLLHSSKIIGAVFRIADFNKIKQELQISDEELSQSSGVHLNLVKSLTNNYRLHLDATLKIFRALREHPTTGTSAWAVRLSRSEYRGNIVVDKAQRTNVQKVAGSGGDDDVFLLNSENLATAPAIGHDWAIGSASDPLSASAGARTDRGAGE